MIALLLIASAFADDGVVILPDRHPVRDDVPGQCAKNYPLVPGRPFPSALVDEDGNVRCGSIAVPSSHYADLLDVEDDYASLRRWAALELTTQYAVQAAASKELEWYQARVVHLEKTPLGARPWFNQAVGGGTVLLSAYVLSLSL